MGGKKTGHVGETEQKEGGEEVDRWDGSSLNQLGGRANDHTHRRGTTKANALEDAATPTRTAPVKEVATT